jgi:hypothetical protein
MNPPPLASNAPPHRPAPRPPLHAPPATLERSGSACKQSVHACGAAPLLIALLLHCTALPHQRRALSVRLRLADLPSNAVAGHGSRAATLRRLCLLPDCRRMGIRHCKTQKGSWCGQCNGGRRRIMSIEVSALSTPGAIIWSTVSIKSQAPQRPSCIPLRAVTLFAQQKEQAAPALRSLPGRRLSAAAWISVAQLKNALR